MRIALAVVVVLASSTLADATCFRECLGGRIVSTSDDIQIKDAARACRQDCEARASAVLEASGLLERVKSCKAEPLPIEDLRKLRAETASYYVQSNVFIWDFTNPFSDRVLTRVEVTAQNMDLNQIGFSGTGLFPPSGEGVFVIPAFYDGYPAVRFAAKVEKVWACRIR